MFSYFHRVAPVVVAGAIMQAFAIPAAALGTLIAIYPYCFAAMALPGGSLADTLGPRRGLGLGGVTMAAGSILFGAAPAIEAALAGRLLHRYWTTRDRAANVRLFRLAAEVLGAIEAGVFHLNVGWQCRACQFRSKCWAWR